MNTPETDELDSSYLPFVLRSKARVVILLLEEKLYSTTKNYDEIIQELAATNYRLDAAQAELELARAKLKETNALLNRAHGYISCGRTMRVSDDTKHKDKMLVDIEQHITPKGEIA